MKKLFFLHLFFSINILTFGANVYFSCDSPEFVCSNGQSFYSGQDGRAVVYYHVWADPTRYLYEASGARFKDPDGNWSDWSQLSSGIGSHDCLKEGTWFVQGRVWVEYSIAEGYSDYYMYTSFTLNFNVDDNYAPSVAQNFQSTFQLNQPPVLTWNANSEYDLSGYRVYKKYTSACCGVWTTSVFTTGTSYTDNNFTANYKFGQDQAEYWVTVEDINSNVSGETQHYSSDGYGPAWKLANNSEEIPNIYKLNQNFPNPFNPSTKIRYQLPEAANVQIKIYDILGTEVAELINGMKSAGYHEATFDTSNLPQGLSSGVYVYRITAIKNDRTLFNQLKRMILLQ